MSLKAFHLPCLHAVNRGEWTRVDCELWGSGEPPCYQYLPLKKNNKKIRKEMKKNRSIFTNGMKIMNCKPVRKVAAPPLPHPTLRGVLQPLSRSTHGAPEVGTMLRTIERK